MSLSVNDNDGIGARGDGEPDAHGQAALLLAESILHLLVETAVVTSAEASAAVRSAAEIKVEIAEEAGESKRRMHESLALLSAIASSLDSDIR